MSEIVLDIKIESEGSLKDDLTSFLKGTLSPAVTKALDSVGADMASALERHIQKDVYDKYSPAVYKRRSENTGLGTPLSEMGDLKPGGGGNATVFNHGNGLTFDYSPTGEHTTTKWHTADGDEIIGTIEKLSPPYTWPPKKRKMPQRPFWQNFVDEMVDAQELEQYFVNSLLMINADIGVRADGGITRDAQDGNY